MNRKTLGIIFLLFGTLLFIGGLMAGVSSFLGMMNGLDPVAELKSPGEVEVTISEPGTYRLRAQNTTQEARRFSLTEGAFMAHLGGFISKAFLWGILAFLGLVLTVVGIIMMILGRKNAAAPVPAG